MKSKIFYLLALGILVFSFLTPAQITQAAPLNNASNLSSSLPAGYLNPDGTLKLGQIPDGSLSVANLSMEFDPSRGPVFTTQDKNEATKGATTNAWRSLGGATPFACIACIMAIAVSGSNVYIGGDFTNANGNQAADYIVKWNGTSWSALGTDGWGNGSLYDKVRAITIQGTDVYVGGYFTNVTQNGITISAADSIARWDGTQWHAVGHGNNDGSIAGIVSTIAIQPVTGNIYVGGWWNNLNNKGTVLTAADNIAMYNPASDNWYSLSGDGGTPGNGSLNYPVAALAFDASGNLYVGGLFSDVNNGGTILTAADGIARWDGYNWSALGSSNGSTMQNSALGNGVVNAIAIKGSDVYVGGNFQDVNDWGTTLNAADYVARWDGYNWHALGRNCVGNGALNSEVHALAFDSSGNLYVGGYFKDVTNINLIGNPCTTIPEADYIVKWNPIANNGNGSWSALGSNGATNGSLNDVVWSVLPVGGYVYVGGDFSDVNNNGVILNTADHIALFGPAPAQQMLNPGFNTYPTVTAKIPSSWTPTHFSTTTDGKFTTAVKEGAASVKIAGAAATTKILSQSRNVSGSAGIPITFSFWVKGYAIPSNGGICQGQVLLYNGTTLKQMKTINCPNDTYAFQKKLLMFNPAFAYTSITIRFVYSKPTGAVFFDLVSLLK